MGINVCFQMTREKFFLILVWVLFFFFVNMATGVQPAGFKESDEKHNMVQENHKTFLRKCTS